MRPESVLTGKQCRDVSDWVLEISKFSSLGNCETQPGLHYENKRWTPNTKHLQLAKEQESWISRCLLSPGWDVGGFLGSSYCMQRPLRMSGIERLCVYCSSIQLQWVCVEGKAFRNAAVDILAFWMLTSFSFGCCNACCSISQLAYKRTRTSL